ncbi:MAG: helix-turn-helix domain-containing protein [Candidatus Parcubacteria bacterium]|nr:helix-turn-helix domain-containing protein [Candidatus Parcubacteria bacterium]
MSEKIYRIEDVAKILNVSVRSVFRYIHGGKLRATKIGYWRISRSDLLVFLAENENIERDMQRDYIRKPKAKKKK